ERPGMLLIGPPEPYEAVVARCARLNARPAGGDDYRPWPRLSHYESDLPEAVAVVQRLFGPGGDHADRLTNFTESAELGPYFLTQMVRDPKLAAERLVDAVLDALRDQIPEPP